MQNLDPVFEGAEQSPPNPFQEDVYAPGITPLPGVTDIHGDVLNRCVRALEWLLRESEPNETPWGAAGRTLLIAAPRAGFGKSHLVGRIRSVTESTITAVSLPFDPIRSVSWKTTLTSLMNNYRSTRCPQNLSCTLFEETARFFQSNCVRMAMENGALNEKEVPETEVAMRVQFRDVFDPKASTKLNSWYAKRSAEIVDASSRALRRRWSLGFDDLAFWNRFFVDSSRPKADPFTHFEEISEAEARQYLTQFLRIASDCRPIVFVADHLDGFFGSETAGMEIARIITTLRSEVPRSVTLLCLNEDLWQSVFEERIPTAWIDRLTTNAVPLNGISVASAEILLQNRLQSAGITGQGAEGFIQAFREDQDWDSDSPSTLIIPREVLREAARFWDHAPSHAASAPAPQAPASIFAEQPISPEKEAQIPSPPPAPTQNDAAAAARAAGKDLTRGVTDIESIIADIRGTGARAVSEGAGRQASRHQKPVNGQSHFPSSRGKPKPDLNPFWAKNLEQRLQELESEAVAANRDVAWESERLIHLIRAVGERFPAVGQSEQTSAGTSKNQWLRWKVMQYEVMLGFEPGSNLLYWKALVEEANASAAVGKAGKIAVLSHPSQPFDFKALTGIGENPSNLLRLFDVITIGENDLRRLYAAETFLTEAESSSQADAAVRVIARRLDPFWRRLTQPLRTSESPAG